MRLVLLLLDHGCCQTLHSTLFQMNSTWTQDLEQSSLALDRAAELKVAWLDQVLAAEKAHATCLWVALLDRVLAQKRAAVGLLLEALLLGWSLLLVPKSLLGERQDLLNWYLAQAGYHM
jgi:hypothetical protein